MQADGDTCARWKTRLIGPGLPPRPGPWVGRGMAGVIVSYHHGQLEVSEISEALRTPFCYLQQRQCRGPYGALKD